MFLIGLIVGLFIGANLGVLIAGFLIGLKREEDPTELEEAIVNPAVQSQKID